MPAPSDTIETQRLILRAITLRDFQTTCAYACDKENTRLMLSLSAASRFSIFKFLLAASRQWKAKNPRFLEFAMIEKGSKSHIGGIGLKLKAEGEYEIGWILNRAFHQKGYCIEAAASLMSWARKSLGAKILTAHADSANEPSIKVMKKLGMKPFAFGFRLYKNGQSASEVMYRVCMDAEASLFY